MISSVLLPSEKIEILYVKAQRNISKDTFDFFHCGTISLY